jgi:hypothetical protein
MAGLYSLLFSLLFSSLLFSSLLFSSLLFSSLLFSSLLFSLSPVPPLPLLSSSLLFSPPSPLFLCLYCPLNTPFPCPE